MIYFGLPEPGITAKVIVFEVLNLSLRGKLHITPYITPTLYWELSNGWNQSRFNIIPKLLSDTSCWKNNRSSFGSLNSFQILPSYISDNTCSLLGLAAH